MISSSARDRVGRDRRRRAARADRRTVRHREPRVGAAPRRAPRRASRATLGVAARLQGVVRQGEPDLAAARSAASGRDEGLADPRRGARASRRAGADRRPRGAQVAAVAEVVDILQMPAFLCRQTDFIVAVAARRASPSTQEGAVPVALGDGSTSSRRRAPRGNQHVLVTERGASFGYNNLVSDMRSLRRPRARSAAPWCSTRRTACSCRAAPGSASGGQREFVPALARAAVAVGVDAVFIEVHEDPDARAVRRPELVSARRAAGAARDPARSIAPRATREVRA